MQEGLKQTIMSPPKDPFKRAEWARKKSKATKGRKLPPRSKEHSKNISLAKKGKPSWNKGIPATEETRRKISDSQKGKKSHRFGKHNTIEHNKKISISHIGMRHTLESRKKQSDIKKGKHPSEETRRKISVSHKGEKHHYYGKRRSEETRMKILETRIGGFWYGNVKYNGKKYCELWNAGLWKRIDAYQNYKSILSGKTKVDNNGRSLSRHHVYWQEKACCEWDEDQHGYYAMINIGSVKRPNLFRYYVGEDPNKFVLLTSQEHGLVSKDKLKWIKIFEDLIEKQGGKCYYTKEEWREYEKAF